MKCPACFNELTQTQLGKVTVDVCQDGCGGIWFDAFELQRVDEKDEAAADELVQVRRDPSIVVDMARKRGCPRCPDIKLKRHFFSAKRQVEVDQCPNCGGYWLDAGELEAIRTEKSQADRPQAGRNISADFIRYLYRLQTEGRAEP